MNRQKLQIKTLAAAEELLRAKGYISMVDVLMAIGKLTKEDHERWRRRQVPHLEQVMPGSLNQFSFLLKTVRAHALGVLGLKPSRTAYSSWGKGPRQPLRFSKYNSPHLEEQYSTHYVNPALAADNAKREPTRGMEKTPLANHPIPRRRKSTLR